MEPTQPPDKQETGLEEIAVFPLPNTVVFPGQIVPLHIFEPRYRRMVHDCLEKGRMLGVALPQSTVSLMDDPDNPHPPLTQNHSTYRPHTVVGAGRVQLNEVLSDGRLLIDLIVLERFKIIRFQQELPYYVALAKRLHDKQQTSVHAEALFHVLLKLSEEILGEHFAVFQSQIPKDILKTENAGRLCFEIFKWCRLDPEVSQAALQTCDPVERADLLAQILGAYKTQTVGSTASSEKKGNARSDGSIPQPGKIIHADFGKKETPPQPPID